MTTIHYISEGEGMNIGQDFYRAPRDLPCEPLPKEFAKPGCIIALIYGNPAGNLPQSYGFLKGNRLYVQVRKQAIITKETTC